MAERITGLRVSDVRFPTSLEAHGSDAMNLDPDYSAAYVELETSTEHSGFGLAFTIGRGNDIMCAAIEALADHVVGTDIVELADDPGLLARRLNNDSHFRWLGPEKGVVHMAIGALVNAGWDLLSRRAGLPLWKYLASLTPVQLVGCIDFRYLTDALTPEQALDILDRSAPHRVERIAKLEADGYPAYTTTPGWLGYTDERLVRLCKEAVADGFGQIKLKVGADVEQDKRRMALAREAVGPGYPIAIDANQRWDVPEAIDWVNELAKYDVAWVEEPTSPDDAVGHATIAKAVHPIPVATGEHCQNRVLFKQLLQLDGAQVVQIDAARVAGVNENLAILLLAARHGVRVCPHAGGVGLCEIVRHLSFFDYVAVSGTTEDRVIEWVDHLHEHFTDPAVVENGNYLAPSQPGSSAEMKPASVAEYTFSPGVRQAS